MSAKKFTKPLFIGDANGHRREYMKKFKTILIFGRKL